MRLLPKWARIKIRRRTLAVSGILLTITSAILGHLAVANTQEQLANVLKDISVLDRSISENWQQMALLEQRKSFSTMLAVLNASGMQNDGKNLIKAYYTETAMQIGRRGNLADLEPAAGGEEPSAQNTFASVITMLSEEKDNTSDAIEAYNAEKLEAIDESEKLQSRSKLFSGIAFFLQITGLMMFLAKDWKKDETATESSSAQNT